MTTTEAGLSRAARATGRWRLALSLLGSAVAVALLLEGGLRLRAFDEDARVDAAISGARARKPPPKGATVILDDVVQLSPNPRLVYELMPNLMVKLGPTFTTNSAGFRSPEIPEEKPPGTARIVGLGDSIMFGTGVHDDEDFVAALAERLARRAPAVRWEYVNTAVPGYNAAMEVEALRTKALRFAPDIVVVNFVGNDFDLPNFIRKRSRPLRLDYSFLGDYVRSAGRTEAPPGELPHLSPAPRLEAAPFRFEHDPDAVPPEYRYMVGWEGYERAMRELHDLATTHGFRVVMIGHPTAPGQVKQLASSLGFPVAESNRYIRRYAKEHGISDIHGKEFWVWPKDPHPTALVHGLIADSLLDSIEKKGILDEVVRKVSGPRVDVAPEAH